MTFQTVEKTYPGIFPRPSAEIVVSERDQLVLITTPWGQRTSSEVVNETVLEYFEAMASDPEATSPYQRLPGLSHTANRLRTAILLANENVYQKANGTSYDSACEVLAIAFNGREMIWSHIGQPSLLLLRNNKLIPLSPGYDLSLDFNREIALPSKLLGLERNIEIDPKSTLVNPGDQLIVISRSYLPESLFASPVVNQMEIFDRCVADNEKLPFWLGLVQIS